MVRCADNSFYAGITNNPEVRLAQHNLGTDPGCYTFTRRPVELVHASDFHEVDDALRWEKQLKGWSRAKKRALIANDWGGRFAQDDTSSEVSIAVSVSATSSSPWAVETNMTSFCDGGKRMPRSSIAR